MECVSNFKPRATECTICELRDDCRLVTLHKSIRTGRVLANFCITGHPDRYEKLRSICQKYNLKFGESSCK